MLGMKARPAASPCAAQGIAVVSQFGDSYRYLSPPQFRGFMKTTGGSLIALGIILLLIALGMETSVSTYMPPTSIYAPPMPGSVNNLGLMQQQMMTFQAGLVAILGGKIFLAAGFIVDVITPAPKQEPQPLPTFVSPPENVEPQTKPDPEALAAEERQMWIWAGATVAVAVGLMLLVALFAAGTRRPDGAAINYSDEALMGNSADAIVNQMEIDALGNVR